MLSHPFGRLALLVAVAGALLAYEAGKKPAKPWKTIAAPTEFARTVDGDTLYMRGFRVRIAGLNCSEMDSRSGKEARLAAGSILRSGKEIECRLNGRRSYERYIGRCFIDGADFTVSMIRGGHCGGWNPSDYIRAWLD